MAGIGKKFDSLRLNRLETERLALVLALSLAVHLLAWGGYEIGREFNFWQRLNYFHRATKMIPPPAQIAEEPLTFVNVDQPSTEAPQNAKYYSDKNSRAANPDPNLDADIPQINGRQADVPKTEDAPRKQFSELQPSPPAQQQPSPAIQPGDLTLTKLVNLLPQKDNPEQERPRKLSQVPGVQMKQNGGVHHHSIVPSFDAKSTPFGNYDAALFDAMQQYWDDELDRINYDGSQTGKVALQFHLNYDGSISDMKVLNSTVGQTMTLMCEMAVLNPSPYAAWPRDMRLIIGDHYRDVLLTFYYY
ncbi:MAG TPA: hypothetical protein VK810_00325 [Dongiaceae bacterium]|jgi:hypothetical protein|nr:hypothetical protein [Dongiaceae bacterium]